MADIQPQPAQQGVQQVKIISSGGAGSGSRPLQMMSNVADGGAGIRPTPVILNASPAGVQIQSSSTPVMMQSAAVPQSPSAGGIIIQSSPPQPASAASGGIIIRSAAPAPQPSYNGPAMGQAPPVSPAAPSVIQPQPIAITPSSPPAPQVGGVSPAGVIRVGAGATAATPQVYSPPQPVAQPSSVPTRPVAAINQPTRSQGAAPPATTGKPRLTPKELLSKADPVWVCGFILAVVGVAFATMVFEGEVSTTWLLLFVSAASVGAFVKLQL